MSRSLNNPDSEHNVTAPSSDSSPDISSATSNHDVPGSEMAGKPVKKKKKTALIIVLIALVIAAGVFAYLFWGTAPAYSQEEVAQIMDDGTFYQGVSILGVDLSGKTMEEARTEVEKAANNNLGEVSAAYQVQDNEYKLSAEQLGASYDIETALTKAMLYGREGGFFERKQAIDQAAANGYEVDVPVSYDQQAILQSVKSQSETASIAPKDAEVKMEKVSDEGKKITDMNITFVDGQTGLEVNEEKLAEDIFATAQSGDFSLIQAKVTEKQPSVTKEQLEAQYTKRGVFQTSYGDSAEGRRYNIWKMSDIINGVKIEPGETWSINKEAGPRTYARGWKGAPGISDGEYKEEAGGGICQVSSTLYNAVIRAEVNIVDKTPHSWPLSYVPGGLDATISTGSPDFVIKNNYDVPIFIVTKCDGEGARTVEVAIFGPAYDDGLTRDFSSNLIGTFGGGKVEYIQDPTLPAGTQKTVIPEHIGKKFQITKHWKDADGKVVKSEPFEVVTYSNKPAKVRVGTAQAAPEPEPVPAPVHPDPAPPAPAPDPPTPAPDPPTPAPEPPADPATP